MSTSQYIDGKYFENHPTWDLEHAPFKARYVYEIILRNKLIAEKIVDVGCGNGGVLAELKKKLPQVLMSGYDVSPQAIAMGEKMYNDVIYLSNENPLIGANKYDIALAMDVIEHVEDMFEFLRQIKQLATYKILHIPLEINLRWILSKKMYANANTANGHIHFFNTEIAMSILKWTGYEIVDTILTPHSIELSKSVKSKIASIPRKLVGKYSDELANKIFGGWSLMVLAK
jgi:2-polyprenyl-3-methyl-5-hydroxy-6-metoxy-1,4-benzoquinol methylase